MATAVGVGLVWSWIGCESVAAAINGALVCLLFAVVALCNDDDGRRRRVDLGAMTSHRQCTQRESFLPPKISPTWKHSRARAEYRIILPANFLALQASKLKAQLKRSKPWRPSTSLGT